MVGYSATFPFLSIFVVVKTGVVIKFDILEQGRHQGLACAGALKCTEVHLMQSNAVECGRMQSNAVECG